MYAKITAAPEGNATNRWLDLSVTNEEHHAMKCISSSSVKYLASGKSPYAFYKNCILKEKAAFEVNEAFRIGTIAHLAVLEPEKFENSVVVCDLNQNTNDFKAFKVELAKTTKKKEDHDKAKKDIEMYEKELRYYSSLCDPEDTKIVRLQAQLDKLIVESLIYEEEKHQETVESFQQNDEVVSKGKKKKAATAEEYVVKYTKDGGILTEDGQEKFIVKSEEMKMYRAFQTQVENHKRLGIMLHECVIEQSGVAQDPETGLWLSLRGDARCPRGYFADPKTMADEITADNIQRYASNFHLLLQDAHYTYTANLIEPNTYKKFFFVMMSKKAPAYEIALVQFDKEDRAWGMKKFKDILKRISLHEQTGKWPSLDAVDGNHGMTIKLPPWSKK